MNVELQQTIKTMINEIYDEIVAIRRDFHQKPEVGFDTKETEKTIKDFLIREGIEVLDSTIGVLGVIRGKERERFIALRADIDALPLQEKNETEYKSIYKNKMHGCGHDGHTAMLLGAARIINNLKGDLSKSVLLIFQSAEEGPDLGGARIFLKEFRDSGLLEKIERIHALHLSNEYDVGKVCVGCGTVAASTDEFHVKIIGEGGHPAEPHKCKDALSIGIKIISEMESFMSKSINPLSNAVFSVGLIKSGTARNIIAGECEFEGTIRCQKEVDRTLIKKHLAASVQMICNLYGVENKLDIIDGLPPLVVDDSVSKLTYEVAKLTIGKNCDFRCEPRMYAEDFAYFAECIPASYIWIGSANREKGLIENLHSPYFDFDEEALATGVLLLCSLAALVD